MTGTKHIVSSLVCSLDKSELKEFIVNEALSEICYTDKEKSKGIIIDECSTEEDES